MTRRTLLSAWILGGLLLLVFLAVLVTPAVEKGRPSSSYSSGSDGVRLAHDLMGRLGWAPEAREVPFSDSLRDPAPIQVLVGVALSEAEAGRLLAFARAGGGVIVAGGNGVIADSLGLTPRDNGMYAEERLGPNCERRGTWQSELVNTGFATGIGSTRPLPEDTVGYGDIVIPPRRGERRDPLRVRAAIGMPHGDGRVVVIADDGFLSNDVLRRCELGTDVDFVRMIEYVAKGQRGLRVAFDEYHHGYGVRGGSFAAMRMYLAGTPSGRMLTQIAIGTLLLLFAAAPRPLAPRDPTHVARRSPLEHADALAHAYASVNATRTATARLLAGVRRRNRARSRARETDEAFLDTAAALSPAAATAARRVASALETTTPERQLPEVAAALDTIEHELTRPHPSPR
jgi:hypothetical protein